MVWGSSVASDLRIAFFGTPAVAVPALEALLDAAGIDVVAVVTNPDRPKGRSGTPVAPSVKVRATAAGVPVLQPLRPVDIVDELTALELDAVAIVAYGAILPQEVLDAGGAGFVNLHFSLLPRWRGAAPVQAAIREGDQLTGVTCFVLDKGMDTGPVLRTASTVLGDRETTGDLWERLALLGGPVLVDAIRALGSGEKPVAQEQEGATVAPKVRPADVEIDLTASAVAIDRLVRSANPAPGAHTTFRGKRLKLWSVRPLDEWTASGEPGAIIGRDEDGVVVATGDGALVLLEVQPEGKARMDGAAFANGYQPDTNDRIGQ